MDIKIFVVKSAADQELAVQMPHGNYEHTIQAGCALTDIRNAEYQDDTGENISALNPLFCEFTALYWMWKNVKADYIGLAHYRRRFLMDDEHLTDILKSGVDVILPLPRVFDGMTVEIQYKLAHPIDAWDVMMNVIKELYPEDYQRAVEILHNDNKVHLCCLGIYRYECFLRYCEWVFPILDRVYTICQDTQWDRYQRRYIAFLGERLHSLFWMLHKEEYTYEYTSYGIMQTETTDSKVELTESVVKNKIQQMIDDHKAYSAIQYVSETYETTGYDELLDIYKMLSACYNPSRYTIDTPFRQETNLDALLDMYRAVTKRLSTVRGQEDDICEDLLKLYPITDYYLVEVIHFEMEDWLEVECMLCDRLFARQELKRVLAYIKDLMWSGAPEYIIAKYIHMIQKSV